MSRRAIPTSGKWIVFVARNCLRVRRGCLAIYNHFRDLESSGLPPVWNPPGGDFYDCASLTRSGLEGEDLRAFPRLCATLGFAPNPGKSAVCNAVVFLGLLATFLSPSNDRQREIFQTDERRKRRHQLIESYLKMGKIPRICMMEFIGRLSSSPTSTIGIFARTQLCPLYRKPMREFNAQMSILERCALERRRQIVADFSHRIAVSRPPFAEWVIYTDASDGTPCDFRPPYRRGIQTATSNEGTRGPFTGRIAIPFPKDQYRLRIGTSLFFPF